MKLAKSLIRLVPSWMTYRQGTALVPSFASSAWPERMFLKRLLATLTVDCVLDVGANLGQYAAELRMIGFKGLIISFEPTPALHCQLAVASKSDPNWETMGVALGSAPGTLPLNVMAGQDFNSFYQPSTAETDSLAGPNTVVDTVEVPIETLNEMLPKLQAQFGFRQPFLKMDTQGHDIAVFDGASEVRDRIVAFQSEVSVKRLYRDIPRWTDAIAHYEQGGFELAGLFAVSPSERELRELDCFMVRRNHAKPDSDPFQSMLSTAKMK